MKNQTSKKIILTGPTCAGKSYIRDKFREKGFRIDVSYTSRQPREGEINGIDYNFISKQAFEEAIVANEFYEYVKYNENYYGTGLEEWEECDIFIMETDGVNKIKPEDRLDCLIIFINTKFDARLTRMRKRGWTLEKIMERVDVDKKKFKDFKNYDLEISSLTSEEEIYD